MLAAIRPAGQDFPVLLHIVGATLVFGALLASATSLALARGEERLLRLRYFSLLFVALPGWILMRLAGEWIYRMQGWNSLPNQLKDAAWLRIGFGVADWGGLLFLVTLVIGGVAVLRLRRGQRAAGLLRATMGIAVVLALAFVVAVWAMTGKPGQPGLSAASAASSAQTTRTSAAVTVTAAEFKFGLSKSSVPHGNVVFTVLNRGKIAHDFSISGKTSSLVWEEHEAHGHAQTRLIPVRLHRSRTRRRGNEGHSDRHLTTPQAMTIASQDQVGLGAYSPGSA